MSETDVATKPAGTAQSAAEGSNPLAADEPRYLQVQPEPVNAKLSESKPSEPAHEDKSEAAQAKTEATEEDAEGALPRSDSQNEKTKMLKTTAKIDHENKRNNRKFDPSVRGITDDPDAIRKQVEFYFGDWNFPQDKFMWESCEGTANKPMPISKIHSFKRMRSFQPYSTVVAALRDSAVLDVSGDEGEETVKRKVPYKPMAEGRVKMEASTVYVKGFGDESPDTQFDLESFFANFGEIKGLKLRRTNEGLFKGSVFVTFSDEEAAKMFIELDPAPTYKGHDLNIMLKRDYCEEKSELIRQGKLEPNSSSQKKFFEGRDSTRRGFRGKQRGGREGGDDWKKRREHDQKKGFQDRRGGGRGRGGRGHGRERGLGRGGRDGGSEHRDRINDAKPRIQCSDDDDAQDASAAANSKRAREEDAGGDGALAAKKVDVKEAAEAEYT